jgi:thioredoxin reductase
MVHMEVVLMAQTTITDGRPGSYDVVVIGGGAAGLSGAVVLARARRSVLVVDAGEPRNAVAHAVHGFLSRDGTPPGELLEAGRAEVRDYDGELVEGRVLSASPAQDGFDVLLADGRTLHARRLLVTTGLVDELPDVVGVDQRWGRDVLHCPYCHGWEVRDQALGVLAGGPMAVHQALLFSQWTRDLTLFLHTAPELTELEQQQLAARGVSVVTGEVDSLVTTDDRLTGVRLRTGTEVPVQVVVVGPRFVARAEVLVSLGLKVTEHPMGVGSYVAADPTGLTEVPGVWVAGNVADPIAQVIGAAAAGVNAAAAINADLVQDEVRQAVAARGGPVGAESQARVAEQVGGNLDPHLSSASAP